MALNGISSFSFVTGLINRTTQTQQDLQKVQVQLASGLVSNDYKDIAADTQRLVDMETDLERLGSQTENAKLIQSRIERMNGAVGQMTDILTQFKVDLTNARGGGFLEAPDLATLVKTYRNSFAAALNTELAGKFLFAGSAIYTQPVDLNDPAYDTAPVIPSSADTDYFQGNTESMNVQIADNVNIDMSFPANSSGFEKALRAMNLIITTPGDSATADEAVNLINESIEEITETRTRISGRARLVETQIFDNESESALLNDLISVVRDVDIAEATLRSQKLSAQIQASFAITSRALSLRLTDYI